MYIPPNSDIYLLKGLKIDANFTNTIYFSTKQAQESYFIGKHYMSLSDQMYVRRSDGRIRVGIPIGQVYGVSYLMYKNTSFEDKWIYAFVTRYEYVNNETTDIFFRIDPIQTYLFDVALSESMVDRQHSLTDVAGDNLIPENLDTGEYLYNEISGNDQNLLWTGAWDICVFTTLNNDGSAQSTVDGQIMGGIYSGLNMYRFTTAADVNAYLTKVSECGAESSVVAITMIPRVLLDMDTDTYNVTYNIGGTVGNYVPRNKKLLTSPWRGVYVTNQQGSVASYSYEYFNTFAQNQATFRLSFSLGAQSDCMLQPVGYKNGARQFGVELTGFPQCAYTTDAYKAWLARNAGYLTLNQTMLQTQTAYANQQTGLALQGAQITRSKTEEAAGWSEITGGLGAMLGMAGTSGRVATSLYTDTGKDTKAFKPRNDLTMGVASGLLSAGQSLVSGELAKKYAGMEYANAASRMNAQIGYNNEMKELQLQMIMQQKHVAELTPPSFHGQSVGNANKLNGDFGYHVGEYYARPEFVARADSFMDLYGYKQNMLMIPYRKARKHWTYLKTTAAAFENHGVPEDDFEAIEALYNGGMRWWVNGDEIGLYSAYLDDNLCLQNPEQ